MIEDTSSFVVSVCYADVNGKPITVDTTVDTSLAADRLVSHIFQDGYFLITPSPSLADDGICRIYIPLSRIMNICVTNQRVKDEQMRAYLEQRKAGQYVEFR